MTYTLSLPDTTPNIFLPPLVSTAHTFSAQRQQSIARLAKRIETWSRSSRAAQEGSMVARYKFSLTFDPIPTAALAAMNTSTEDPTTADGAAPQESPVSSTPTGVQTPPSERALTHREAEMLASIRQPDYALVEMGHATLRNLVREARTKLREIEQMITATAAQDAAEEPAQRQPASAQDGVDGDVESKLRELKSLLDEFDGKLRTWTDVITGGDGINEIELEHEGGFNANCWEPRAELLNLRREREELAAGAESLLERRNGSRGLEDRVEGWLADVAGDSVR